MHKSRLKKSLLLLVLFSSMLLALASCSAVFKANLGGKVHDDESDAGIANMAIYAYTNTTQRDSDWQNYTGGTFNPSSAAGYIARTNSDNDGSFVINKIVWESTFPEFGKTADYKEIALLFYHEDYGLHKNKDPVWITSDSTNASMVDEKFSKENQTTNIEVDLRDVVTGGLVYENFNVILKVEQEPGDTDPKEERATIRGNGSIAITYPAKLKETEVSATVTLPNSTWMQCHKDGPQIEEASFTIERNNSDKITLYLKQGHHEYPAIQGEIDIANVGEDEKTNDNLIVLLGKLQNETIDTIELFDEAGAQTITRLEGTGANGAIIRHGVFTNLGTNMTWEDKDYDTKSAKKDLVLVVDMDRDGKLSDGDYYHKFSIFSSDEYHNLGKLRASKELEKVGAGGP